MFVIAGGRICCNQCQAISKRTKQQCRAPAVTNKNKCRFHGGASTGPKTDQGRQRCAKAKTIHGHETRKARAARALASRRLRDLEDIGRSIGLIRGAKTVGRKPKYGHDLPSVSKGKNKCRIYGGASFDPKGNEGR